MLPDVLQSLQSIFSGYYLQALAISTNIGKINVVKHLDKLNPNRNVGVVLAIVRIGSCQWNLINMHCLV